MTCIKGRFEALSGDITTYPADKAAKVVWRVLSARLRHHTLPEKVFLLFFSVGGLSDFINNVPPPDNF